MTVRERAAHFAEKAATVQPAGMAALFEEAIREELKDVASTLQASAASKETMYRELGLHGEDQARPYREIAQAVQRRSEL
jgi:hypothetical protein